MKLSDRFQKSETVSIRCSLLDILTSVESEIKINNSSYSEYLVCPTPTLDGNTTKGYSWSYVWHKKDKAFFSSTNSKIHFLDKFCYLS